MNEEEIARGMVAYEQARAFERIRIWRLPAIYFVLAAIFFIFALAFLIRYPRAENLIGFSFPAFSIFAFRQHWQRLKRGYAENLTLLQKLEAQHGRKLPWLEVEDQLAEIAKIEAEQAREANPS